MNHIKKALLRDPSNCGFRVWDCNTVSHYIKDRYDINLNRSACWVLFGRLNLSYVTPQMFSNKGRSNKKERKIFKKQLKQYNNDQKFVVVFQDECHYNLQLSVTGKWHMKGKKCQISSHSSKKSVRYSGYVIPSTPKFPKNSNKFIRQLI